MKTFNFAHVRWIFFDLGNTLVDESRARPNLLAQLARRLRKEGVSVVPRQLARSLKVAFADFEADPWHAALGKHLPCPAATRRILDETPYPKHLEQPYAFTLPLVTHLAAAGFRLGVIANQSRGTKARLRASGLSRYFSCCLASAEVGFAKPDMRIFRLAQEHAGCFGDALMMIGDRLDNDIRPARELGWSTIRILRGLARNQRPRDFLDRPDWSCSFLPALLNRLANVRPKI